MFRRITPLNSFIAATILSTIYIFVFVFISERIKPYNLNNLEGYLLLILVPILFSFSIQVYSSIRMKLSLNRSLLQSIVSAFLAPSIAMSILFFVGFVLFGWEM